MTIQVTGGEHADGEMPAVVLSQACMTVCIRVFWKRRVPGVRPSERMNSPLEGHEVRLRGL
jgi:hypothetical protein